MPASRCCSAAEPRSGADVLETLVVIGICSLYMLALGNMSSVHYPRALNPERVSQGGASSRFQGLVFMFYPAGAAAGVPGLPGALRVEQPDAFYVVLALAAILGAALYRMATESAVHTATARREQILQELSRSDGPGGVELKATACS